ncbi:MAG TPA: hypothetical protein VFT79_13470 [Solirubrobacterales bacterium]|nr:hypothetical protein [Solirubrobacterales bacterium]
MATEDSLVSATAFHPRQVSACLHLLEEKKWVRCIEGRVNGIVITRAGQEAHRTFLRNSLYPVPVTEEVYARFAVLNDQFKAVCTAWQVRPDGQPNDHSDPTYDRSVLAQLWVVHEAVALILRDLALVARHFERYEERLNDAVNRVSHGDRSALLLPLSNSYHDIWMELHHDLRLAVEVADTQVSSSQEVE